MLAIWDDQIDVLNDHPLNWPIQKSHLSNNIHCFVQPYMENPQYNMEGGGKSQYNTVLCSKCMGKVAGMGPKLYTVSNRMSIDAWDQFQVHTIQLLPSVDTISSDVTWKGQLILASVACTDRCLMSVAIYNKMHVWTWLVFAEPVTYMTRWYNSVAMHMISCSHQ